MQTQSPSRSAQHGPLKDKFLSLEAFILIVIYAYTVIYSVTTYTEFEITKVKEDSEDDNELDKDTSNYKMILFGTMIVAILCAAALAYYLVTLQKNHVSVLHSNTREKLILTLFLHLVPLIIVGVITGIQFANKMFKGHILKLVYNVIFLLIMVLFLWHSSGKSWTNIQMVESLPKE